MIGQWAAALASFCVTLLAICALRPVAVAVDLVDRPGGHKFHHGTVPIVGGLAMFLGVVMGMGIVPRAHDVGPEFLAACAILVTIGLLDDRFDLSPWTRLPVQISAAILMMVGTDAMVTTLGLLPSGVEVALHGWTAYAFTVLITIAAINAFNMLDGMDGLAGATAVISLGGLTYLAWSAGLRSLAAVCLMVAGAVCAFLVFNVPVRLNRRMRCFMGDAGSTLLGFAIAWLCISVSQGPVHAAAPVTTLWIVALPLYELVWSTGRRVIRGVSPVRPDRNHFHHLLLRAGLGVRGAFIVYVSMALTLALVGILLNDSGIKDWQSLSLLAISGVFVVRLMYRAELLWNLLPQSLQHAPAPEMVDSPRSVP
ncbi:MAG: hypothetical protein ACREUT_06845 [Steroidobacteraceae bacterium]